MTDTRFLPLIVVTFLLVAALSGGATVAVLSDEETVTTFIEVGNASGAPGGIAVTALTSDTASVESSTDVATTTTTPGTESATPTGDEGTATPGPETATPTPTATPTEQTAGLTVSLQPTTRVIDVGEETTYEVVVENAVDGIGAYDLTLALSNTSVASFENFSHAHGPRVHSETVEDGELEVTAGMTAQNTIEGDDEVVLGTVTVAGTAGGETELTVVEGVDSPLMGGIVDGNLPNATRYDVDDTVDSDLTVDDGDDDRE